MQQVHFVGSEGEEEQRRNAEIRSISLNSCLIFDFKLPDLNPLPPYRPTNAFLDRSAISVWARAPSPGPAGRVPFNSATAKSYCRTGMEAAN